MTRYTTNGKQVLRDGEHYADAVSPEAAQGLTQGMNALDKMWRSWAIDNNDGDNVFAECGEDIKAALNAT